jgi:hypothetical protein
MGKSTFAPPVATVHHEMVSNKGVQMVMHFASEERGEPKLHSLSPPMHLLAALGPTLQQRREGVAAPAQSAPPPVATQGAAVAVTTRRRGPAANYGRQWRSSSVRARRQAPSLTVLLRPRTGGGGGGTGGEVVPMAKPAPPLFSPSHALSAGYLLCFAPPNSIDVV